MNEEISSEATTLGHTTFEWLSIAASRVNKVTMRRTRAGRQNVWPRILDGDEGCAEEQIEKSQSKQIRCTMRSH